MSDEFEWDFEDNSIDAKAYEKSMARYLAPVKKHVCDNGCAGQYKLPNYHEIEDIFDDFELSTRQREKQRMEIRAAQNRDSKERMLLRMFQGVATQLFYIRMQTSTSLTVERMGEITFDTREDCEAYYNYCIDIFGFDKRNKVGQEDEFEDMFSALDDSDDLFEGLEDDDEDDLFAIDEDDDPFDFDEDDDDEGLWD